MKHKHFIEVSNISPTITLSYDSPNISEIELMYLSGYHPEI